MRTPRLYTEQEIAAIFERAAKSQEAMRSQPEKGLSLDELQAIGAASGIDPEHIARAAAVVDHRGTAVPTRRLYGLPIGVEHYVDLPDGLSDEAWECFVVDIRETFAARGALQREGSLRQWTNGNLHVLVEPAETGDRVRMKTRNANMQGMLISGTMGLVAFAALAFLVAFSGDAGKLWAILPLLLASFTLLMYGVVKLPGWAQTRTKQMEALATRAVELALPVEGAHAVTHEQRFAVLPQVIDTPHTEPLLNLHGQLGLAEPVAASEQQKNARRTRI